MSDGEVGRAELIRRASCDPLTGLANRAGLTEQLEAHLAAPGRAAAVLYLDLDGFKEVNDSLGHGAGDDLLVAVAGRLRQQVRSSDVVSRLGGDEFVVALLDDDAATTADTGAEVAQRVLTVLRDPVRTRGRTVRVSASIGVAVSVTLPGAVTSTGSGDTLLDDADAALYQRKASGRDGVTWCDDALREQVRARRRMEADLRRAAHEGQLALHYQPVLDLATSRVDDVEALLRWHHPEHGQLSAEQPVAIAERAGLIADVGAWALTAAVRDAAHRWGDRDPLTVWVNVSALQLVEQGFTDGLLHQLAHVGLPPWRFGVEVAEGALSAGARVETELVRLSASGIRVAVDDFGAGASSLVQLSRFPVDVLKVDAAFTARATSRRGRAVLEGIVVLGHALGAQVVAEGVERHDQLQVLRDVGVDGAQGHLLARPGPPDAVLERLVGALGPPRPDDLSPR